MKNPTGSKTAAYRVIRGGAWGSDAVNCRSAFRDRNHPGNCYVSLGFRLARTRESMRNPTGPKTGSDRVIRGGPWGLDVDYCRSACRYGIDPGLSGHDLGFRLARSVQK